MAKITKPKLVNYQIQIIPILPDNFDAKSLSISVTSAKSTDPKEFNPHTFKNVAIPFEIYFERLDLGKSKKEFEKSYSIELLENKINIKSIPVTFSVFINSVLFQTKEYTLKEVITSIKNNKPLSLNLNEYKEEVINTENSKVKFKITDNKDNGNLKLTFCIDYSINYKGIIINEEKKIAVFEDKEIIVEIPQKKILCNELKIRILDIQNNEIQILNFNNKELYKNTLNKDTIKYTEENIVEIKIDEIAYQNIDPRNIYPSRIRGKVIDITAKKRISNTQIILFQENGEKAFLLTKTNLSADFSAPYPQLNFNNGDKVYAMISEKPDIKIYLDLEKKVWKQKDKEDIEYYRLSEYNLIVLNDISQEKEDDCNCNENTEDEKAGDCSCKKEKVSRLAEYEDLINDDQYTQDIGGSCLNFSKPNRTLSESTFYAIVRTTEPKIIGLDLMQVDDYLKKIESSENFRKEFAFSFKGPYSPFLFNFYKPAYRIKDRFELSDKQLVDWDETPISYQAVTLAFGHLIEYRQRFYSNGYSLGNIITAEGLAPGQVKKIAVLDWKRSQTSSREESMSYRDELEASTDHTQDFEELQSAMLSEHSSGGSSSSVKSTTASLGAAIGGVFPGGIFGIAGGVGTTRSSANSKAWQDSSRNTSANMNSHLADKTKQAAKNIRNQRATVISTDTQLESEGARTEVLANYNHCHAITNVFFEVLRHVAVKQQVSGVSECIFVPLLISEFTKEKIYRWKEHLKNTMLSNPVLRKKIGLGFDALERKMSTDGYANFPNGSYADEKILEIYGELEAELNISMPVDDYNPNATGNKYTLNQTKWERLISIGGLFSSGGFNGILSKIGNTTLANKVSVFNKEYAPKIATNILKKLVIKANGNETLPLDFTLSNSYTPDKKVKVFVRSKGVDFGLKRNEINNITFDIGQLTFGGITISLNDLGTKAVIKSAKLYYRTKYSTGILCSSATVENDLGYGDPVVLYTPPDNQELKNQRKEDDLALQNLIAICNENMERLHASIWMTMSEQKIFFLLDGIKLPREIDGIALPDGVAGKSVASIVNSKPIGVVGNSLVFRVTDGINVDPIYRIVDMNAEDPQAEIDKIIEARQIPVEDLTEMYQPITPVEPYQISFPTGGYFMETIIGACNSCEKIDDSRFWKWEEHPIPITPSDIQPVSLDTRYQQPLDTKPTEFPQSNISIQNIPQGTQPTGLGASLDLLGKSGLFKDITGLEGTQNLASKGMDISKGAMESAMSNAVSAMNSAAAYDLAKDKQKSDNFEKLMKANLPPEVKQKIAEDYANDTFSNDNSKSIKDNLNKIIDQANKSIKDNPSSAETFNKVARGLKGNFDELSIKPDGEITAKGGTLNSDLKQWVTNNSDQLLTIAREYDLKQDGKENQENVCWAYALATTLYPAYNWDEVGGSNESIIEKVLGLINTNQDPTIPTDDDNLE